MFLHNDNSVVLYDLSFVVVQKHFTKITCDISAKFIVDILFFLDSSVPKDIWNPKHKACLLYLR